MPADGPDQYRCFVLPMDIDSDVYVGAIEFRPGNRRVVHHALVFLDTFGDGTQVSRRFTRRRICMLRRSRDSRPPECSAAGHPATPPPTSQEWLTPSTKGTDVVVQIHYHPSGKPEEDQSELGLRYRRPPTKGRTA